MLDRIIQAKQVEVARLRASFRTHPDMIKASTFRPESLRRGPKGLGVIAEIKKASPSKGQLCREFNPVGLALDYQANGAAAVSVLTEKDYFFGSLEDLQAVKNVVSIPALRKDFILEEVQVDESASAGADMVLLIAALHPYQRLLDLCERCLHYGMQPLVEIHSRQELDLIMDLPAVMIGVNNRNLKDFSEDISTSLDLAHLIPSSKIRISASAIRCAEDMMIMDQAGYDLVLIGETLVTATHPGPRLGEMLDYRRQALRGAEL